MQMVVRQTILVTDPTLTNVGDFRAILVAAGS